MISDDQSSIAFFLNPTACGGKAKKIWNKLEEQIRRKKLSYSLFSSEYHRHIISLVQVANRQGIRRFVAVGGDGTLHELVHGVMLHCEDRADAQIGLIPVGTGNDWARMHKIPIDPLMALETALNGRIVDHDVGKLFYHKAEKQTEEYFINFVGFGFDAIVVRWAERLKRFGKVSYMMATIIAMIKMKHYDFRFYSKEKDRKYHGLMLIAGICKYGGSGMNLCPNAIPDDGLFHIYLVGRLGRLAIMRHLKKLYNGRLYNHADIEEVVTGSFTLEDSKDIVAECDGELIGKGPFQVDVIKRAIRVVVPR